MSGYIILNEKGNRLTKGKSFGAGDGWVWSEAEKDEILANCFDWQFKPVAVQQAYLNRHNMSVVVIGQPVPVRIGQVG